MRTAKVLFLTVFGCGLSPFAPGTWGAAAGVVLLFLFGWLPYFVKFLAFCAVFALAVFLSGESEELFGEPDSPKIVVDEVLGMWVTLFGVHPSFWNVVNGFLLFRFFDIYKVPIVSRLERLPGGWGVVLDDVGAAVLANIILRVIAS